MELASQSVTTGLATGPTNCCAIAVNVLSRETIIALRARHTAFRIAIDILYPPQPPPTLAQPAIPVVEEVEQTCGDWQAVERAQAAVEQLAARRLRRFIIILFAALALLFVYAVWDAMNRPSPPPLPQGRPIPEMPDY